MYIESLVFVIAALAIFSFILKFDFLQTLRDGIIGIMVVSVGLAGLLVKKPQIIPKKKVSARSA
ncbi:hypothetical protein ES706_01085 [subsurface metagenome]|nr:hypothetical protein [Hadesarchaea archaeon]